MKKFIIYTDGGARGNPGPAGIGVVLQNKDGDVVGEWSEFLGVATNNQAEYKALLLALKQTVALGVIELECRLDSELVVKQLKGEYKIKNSELKLLNEQAKGLISQLKDVSFKHVRREQNKRADQLANQAMDRGK